MDEITIKGPHQSADRERQPTPSLEPQRPSRPWEVDVDVYLKSVGPPAQFDILCCLPVDQNGNIVFYNNGRPGFTVNFRLYDDTNSGYVFPNPPAPPNKIMKWAMWSTQGQGCPPQGSGQWPEFTSVNVKDQGQTLVVRNTNTTQTNFGYTLRVTNDGGATFVDLDPGGTNENGNSMKG